MPRVMENDLKGNRLRGALCGMMWGRRGTADNERVPPPPLVARLPRILAQAVEPSPAVLGGVEEMHRRGARTRRRRNSRSLSESPATRLEWPAATMWTPL